MKVKEREQRNNSALQQMAEMVDSAPGIGPVITEQLFEKGLEMPPPSTTPMAKPSSRATSRSSLRASGRESKISVSAKDADDDGGMLSRMSIRTFASTTSIASCESTSVNSMGSRTDTALSVQNLSFSVDGLKMKAKQKSVSKTS